MGEVVFFDESNFSTARSFAGKLADAMNQLADMLAEHRIEVGPEAMRDYLTGTDAIAMAILQKQNEELAGLPELVRSRMLVPVDLTDANNLLRDMAFSNSTFFQFQQQAGRQLRQPIEFMRLEAGKYCVDEELLKRHFSVYKSEAVTSIVNKARAIEVAFNDLSDECREAGIRLVGDNYGILHLDADKRKLSINMGATRFIV